MTFIDLSHEIHESMPVYPGMSQPIFEKSIQVKTHGYAETLISLLSHTGTHIDAPAHMHESGKTLGSYEINSFIGKARMIDVQGKTDIDLNTIQSVANQILDIDFIIFWTGWSNFWDSETYFKGFPTLSPEAAKWIANTGIKGIGLDCISADIAESTNFPVHQALFSNNKLIVENLMNLDKLPQEIFMFSCLPLKYKQADGSPVRAIAWY